MLYPKKLNALGALRRHAVVSPLTSDKRRSADHGQQFPFFPSVTEVESRGQLIYGLSDLTTLDPINETGGRFRTPAALAKPNRTFSYQSKSPTVVLMVMRVAVTTPVNDVMLPELSYASSVNFPEK